jgi:predicted regulator of Ras-like GTPase activity (Roadblock/LC7/MglB family)
MANAVPQDPRQDLAWLLGGLAGRVPHTRSVVLFSADGLLKDFHGLGRADAEHLSAIASGLFSLSRGAGDKFGASNGVRQVVVELDDLMLFVSAAGYGSGLAVLADNQVDAAVLGYEMAQLVKSVRPFLATPTRQSASMPHGRPPTEQPAPLPTAARHDAPR